MLLQDTGVLSQKPAGKRCLFATPAIIRAVYSLVIATIYHGLVNRSRCL